MNEFVEDQYWKDFNNGKNLDKYGIKTIKVIMLDRWQSQDPSFFAFKNREELLRVGK